MAYTLRRARSREDALDAVSETFMVVWRRLDDVPRAGRSVPWVYGIARRVLANQYRSQERATRLTDKVRHATAAESDDPTFDAVHRALARLRSRDREILTLSAWDDLANLEIAEVLEVSEKNVAVRLHRARRRFAAELAKIEEVRSAKDPNEVKHRDGGRTPRGVEGTPEKGVDKP